MNKDAEAINQFLAWLSQEPDPAIAPSGRFSPAIEPEESGEDWQPYIDPLDSEVEAMQADLSELSTVFTENFSSLELGELPAVQDRFHTIIKRRLRAEIERKPPLFPWETSLWDYESEQPDWLTSEGLPTSLWSAQLQTVKLPVSLPKALLLQIFAECRKVVQTSLREGVKLVRAVESFFPDEAQALNHWAGQVLAEPVRSSSQTLSSSALPQTYESANPTQQMVLSLLAARQVLDAMTLEVSADHPQAQRHWMTTAGELVLEVRYQPETQRLRVEGQLPAEGRLTLNGEMHQTTAACSSAETLTVELGNAIPSQLYSLEVELPGNVDSSLTFAIQLVTETA
jgi:hypothetical protein